MLTDLNKILQLSLKESYDLNILKDLSEQDFTFLKKSLSTPMRYPIICADGFQVSIQANSYTYCTPRDNDGPYEQVELGFLNDIEPIIIPYVEDKTCLTGSVYGYVPKFLVEYVLHKHGGVVGLCLEDGTIKPINNLKVKQKKNKRT